jgi:aminopeptidase N
MLRGVIGTEKFWTGIREYYRRYRNLNASTDDFRQVMEQAAGTDLAWFFDQWLKRPGMPKLSGTWRYDPVAKEILVDLAQTHAGPGFRLPLEVGIEAATGPRRIERIELTGKQGRFTIAAAAEPSAVVLDPDTWVLAETVDFAKKP